MLAVTPTLCAIAMSCPIPIPRSVVCMFHPKYVSPSPRLLLPSPPHTHSSLCCQVIEEKCLQDLMYVAIHAPRGGPHSLFAAVRTVLTPFHRQQRGAGDTVHTLYQPFLWRSLKVQTPYNPTTHAAMNTYLICNSSPILYLMSASAHMFSLLLKPPSLPLLLSLLLHQVANQDVRANAVCLLSDAFPVLQTSMDREGRDSALQMQFDIFKVRTTNVSTVYCETSL